MSTGLILPGCGSKGRINFDQVPIPGWLSLGRPNPLLQRLMLLVPALHQGPSREFGGQVVGQILAQVGPDDPEDEEDEKEA